MKYTVHVYATIRIPIEIEAESQAKALEAVDSTFCLREHLPPSLQDNDAEQTIGFMIDEAGDSEYVETRNYNAHLQPV